MRIVTRNSQHPRRGHTFLIAVTVLTICSVIIVSLTRTTLQRYAFADRLLLKTQADCIAESAILRASYQLAQDPNYTGETWNVESLKDDLGLAKAEIEVNANTIHVSVAIPSDAPATRQVRVERQRLITSTDN